jgi:hypothetical protein
MFVGRDVQKQLDEADSRVDQHALELVDFAIGTPPFLFGREAFDAFHQHAAIPGAVERNDLPVLRQASPEALEALLCTLVFVRRGDRVNLETSRIKSPAKAANDATLAAGIPSLKDEDRPAASSRDTPAG